MVNPFHNPLPASLSSKITPYHPHRIPDQTHNVQIEECKKAGKILNSFINPKQFGGLDGGTFLDGGVPRSILSRAKVSQY